MDILQSKGQRFSVTAESISGSAVATEAASTGKTHYITDISASSPVSTCIIELVDSGTVLWKNIIGTGGHIKESFITPRRITSGNAATLRAGTTTTIYVNLSGFTI